jgi:glutathione S-transferase
MSALPPTFPPLDLKPTPAKAINRGPFAVVGFIIKCLSRSDLKRAPPSTTKTVHLRLITIAASHFCEKARWALDLLEEDPDSPYYYTEDGHTPPFLSFETVPVSGGKASASPMLVYPDGAYLVKSDAILRKLCPFLYPTEIADRVKAMEDDLALRIGTSLRCVVYHTMLQKPNYDTLGDVVSKNTSRVEETLLRVMLQKGVADVMRKVMRINPETHNVSFLVLRQAFAEYSELLSDGRDYLCDDDTANKKGRSHGFTAADLTLAALAAPLLQPDCYNATFGIPSDRLPVELRSLQKELRESRAGQHAMKMYDKHRPTANGVVLFKSSSRRDQIDWRRVLPVAAVAGAVVAAAVSTVIVRLS